MTAKKKAPLRDRIVETLKRVAHPTTEKDLLKRLRVKGSERVEARKLLRELVASGAIAQTRTGRYGLADKMNLIPGMLSCKPSGFGFVRPLAEDWSGADIYIGAGDLAGAIHGDRVLVQLRRRGREGRYEGRITDVLEHNTETVVGRLEGTSGGTRVIPFDPRFLYEIFITSPDLQGAQNGDMVVAELTEYPTPFRAPLGRIVRLVGALDEPGVDIQVVMAKYGLSESFPDAVITESETFADAIPSDVIDSREDFRNRDIVTIDGETARDFDDAVEVERLANGDFVLGVHIADVSYYVRPGSQLDQEAQSRSTSVYFPDRAVPMLPERLSNGVCSLKPGVDRLVQSTRIHVHANGTIGDVQFFDGVIRSAARMTYTNVRKILVDRDRAVRREYASLIPHFEAMLDLFHVLRARRQARGSIDLDRPEAEIVMDDQGDVVDIRRTERNVAHRLIEEFMLLANEVVASEFQRQAVPALHRVHESPDEDRVENFEDLLTGFGYSLRSASEPVGAKQFQRLLHRLEGKPEYPFLSYLLLRSMKQAVYSAESRGHFALATKFYTHFTSPIRRYPDLIVHRLLRELRHDGIPEEGARRERERLLPKIAEQSSFLERQAVDAERELEQWKKVRFMRDKLGEVFDGMVSGVTGFGLYVELERYFVEGLVHISSLADDYYHFNELTHTLKGESGGRRFRLGDQVKVQVVRVDLHHRNIDLAIEGMVRDDGGRLASSRPPPRARRRK